jgi:hypothetical protein
MKKNEGAAEAIRVGMEKTEVLQEASGSEWKKRRCCRRHPGRDGKNEGAAGGIRVGMKKAEMLREASGSG